MFGAVDGEVQNLKHLIFEPDGPMLQLPPYLLITEQEPLSLMSHAIGAALNVGLNLYLIPTMGIVGAAWATLISYAYASFFFLFMAKSTRSQLWQLLRVRRSS